MTGDGLPRHILIKHDDHHAEFVGRTADNRQFFLTNPFVPRSGDHPGREFLALYIFDRDGELTEARIEDLGVRKMRGFPPGNKLDIHSSDWLVRRRLTDLGGCAFGDIKIKPFSLVRFGVEFGLIPRAPEEPEDDWSVNIEPGDYMAFYPPWDGEYYT